MGLCGENSQTAKESRHFHHIIPFSEGSPKFPFPFSAFWKSLGKLLHLVHVLLCQYYVKVIQVISIQMLKIEMAIYCVYSPNERESNTKDCLFYFEHFENLVNLNFWKLETFKVKVWFLWFHTKSDSTESFLIKMSVLGNSKLRWNFLNIFARPDSLSLIKEEELTLFKPFYCKWLVF